MAEVRPSVFVGSSSEGSGLAEAIQVNLDRSCEVVIWNQGVFGLSGGTLETIVAKATDFDFAILLLTPDDMIQSRDQTQQGPRDNVLIELGLFIGVLGRRRTFVVYDRVSNIKLPSDLAGVTHASYQRHASGNLQSSVGAACTIIKTAITEQGFRERTRMNFDVDQNSHFQVIAGLLDPSAIQFLILMHEQGVAMKREPMFGGGTPYLYSLANRSLGHGYFSVGDMCKKLPDAGLLQLDMRENVTITSRGQQFAMWLLERGYKAVYFKSDLGAWGDDSANPLPGQAWPPEGFGPRLVDPGSITASEVQSATIQNPTRAIHKKPKPKR